MNMDPTELNEDSVSRRQSHRPDSSHLSGVYQVGGRSHKTSGNRRRRYRRRVNPGFVILVCAAILVALIVFAVCFRACNAKPTIVGRWDMDGTTVYEFHKDGKGALVLPAMEFEFTYKLEENVLTIDFVDERAADSKYEFAIEKDMLMLTGGPNDTVGEYVLMRDK